MRRSSFFILMISLLTNLFSGLSYAQNESQYTQYRFNTMKFNPAFTGNRRKITSIFLRYRNQWVGMTGAPRTLDAALQFSLGNKRPIGLGLEFVNDKIGPANANEVVADFSYTIPLEKGYKFAFGVKGGVKLLNVDPDKLNPYDYNGLNLSRSNHTEPIVGTGLYIYNETWYFGVSSPNLIKTKHYDDYEVSKANRDIIIYITGGYEIKVNQNITLAPLFLVKGAFGAPVAVDLSVNTTFYNKLILGLDYRWDAAISVMGAFQIRNDLMIGYAYDYTMSEIRRYNKGSHEIFLRFDLFQ